MKDILLVEGRSFDSNVYCIGDTLIDTGTGINIQRLWDAVKPEKIKRIVNTHCHVDHIGGNRYFRAKVYAHELDAPAIETMDPERTLSLLFPAKLEPMEVTKLKDGQSVKLGTHTFEVIHTPGHTIGSMCLYEKSKKILISGDTIFADGGVGRTDFPTGNMAQLKQSVEKLSKLKIEALLPGHGPAIWEGAEKHLSLARRILSSDFE